MLPASAYGYLRRHWKSKSSPAGILPIKLLAAIFNIAMKTSTSISRILLGFIYLVFGLDYYLHLIPYQPNHTGAAAAFKDGLTAAGYFYPMMKSIQIIGGISLLINRYAPFSAVVLFPISINVFLFHTILVPSGWFMGVLLIVPNLFLGYAYRKYYTGMFVRKARV